MLTQVFGYRCRLSEQWCSSFAVPLARDKTLRIRTTRNSEALYLQVQKRTAHSFLQVVMNTHWNISRMKDSVLLSVEADQRTVLSCWERVGYLGQDRPATARSASSKVAKRGRNFGK